MRFGDDSRATKIVTGTTLATGSLLHSRQVNAIYRFNREGAQRVHLAMLSPANRWPSIWVRRSETSVLKR